MTMLTLSLLLLTAAPNPDQRVAPQGPLKMVLKVGEQSLTPASHATRCTCVDKTLAEPELVDHRIELKGTKKGTTTCTLQERGKAAVIIELTVQ